MKNIKKHEQQEDPIISQLRDMKRDAKKYDKINIEELENIYRKADTANKSELENKYPWLSLVEIDDIMRKIESDKMYRKSISGKDEWRIMHDQDQLELYLEGRYDEMVGSRRRTKL